MGLFRQGWFVILIAAPASAFAQPAQPNPPSALEQALSEKLMNEIGGSLKCSADNITAQKLIQSLQARVKELEEKAK